MKTIKQMKTLSHIVMALALCLTVAACDKDGDLITTTGTVPVTLDGSGDAALDINNTSALALTLYWTDNSHLTTSDSRVQAPIGTVVNTLQFSATEAFEDIYEEQTDEKTTSKQYTAADLNAIASRLGLESYVASPLYIRMASSLANNVATQYSNTYVINVTPYHIDMSVAYVLDANRTDTGNTLGSPESDGRYRGFLGVSGWYNWWLLEGDGTLWGNIGDDGDGKPFVISSNDQHWNFWYPGQSGCYYTVVNTIACEWSALYIPSLTLGGDLAGEMTYNRKENQWTYTYNATSAGSINITITGTGLQYDSSTGTDDANAVSTPVAFGQENGKITFGSTGSTITVNVPATGEVTLTLDLNDPFNWTCTVAQGGTATVELPQSLYCVGIDDGEDNTWKFKQQLWLCDEGKERYAGVVDVNSLWGYRLYTEKDSWTGYYGLDSGDAMSGTLAAEVENNIPAPAAGLYVIEASTKEKTYALTAVSSVQITGINDDWSLTQMTATSTPGIYEATIAVTASTPWGFKIVLNNDWSTFFGGTADYMLYNVESNIPFDDSYIGSSVKVTVDFTQNKISFAK